MEVLIPIIGLIIAVAVLTRATQICITGAKSLASAFGVPSLTIDVIIVGFGALLPALSIALVALFQGSDTVVLSYVVGSHITTILLILGFSALVSGTLHFHERVDRMELPAFVLATLFLILTLQDDVVDSVEAFFLLGAFIAYTWHLLDGEKEEVVTPRPPIRIQSVGYIIGGFVALVLGASIALDMIERLSTLLTLSIDLLSMTVLAIGTAIPGLIVAIRALREHEQTLPLGSVLGSSIVTILFVLGISGMVTSLKATPLMMTIGIPFFVVASVVLVVFAQRMHIRRFEGMMLLILFGYFLAKLVPFL